MAIYANIGGANKLLAQTSNEGGGSAWQVIYDYSWTTDFSAPLNINCNLKEWENVKILAKGIKTKYAYSGASPKIVLANSSKIGISSTYNHTINVYSSKVGSGTGGIVFPNSQSEGESYYSTSFVVDIDVFGNYYALCRGYGSGYGVTENVLCGEISSVAYIQLDTVYSATIVAGGSIYIVGKKK